jgi:hypothetical protein
MQTRQRTNSLAHTIISETGSLVMQTRQRTDSLEYIIRQKSPTRVIANADIVDESWVAADLEIINPTQFCS